MDNIREAFQKVKQDIDVLKKEMALLSNNINENINETRKSMSEICEIISKIIEQTPKNTFKPIPTQEIANPTLPTHTPTHSNGFEALKHQNLHISTGNEGVPTDRQTNQQTDNYAEKITKTSQNSYEKLPENSIENAVKILDSLDNIKKEIRLKFKRLTEQETLIFSSIYQLENEQGYSDYKSLSKKLNLSESSIRDYVGKLIRKGIPIDKIRVNNKYIQLKISQNLRKIASLSTILQLREL